MLYTYFIWGKWLFVKLKLIWHHQFETSCLKWFFFLTSLPSSSTSRCDAKGSRCSWSKYFSKLKKVSKKIGVIRHRFKSCNDITFSFFGIIISNIWKQKKTIHIKNYKNKNIIQNSSGEAAAAADHLIKIWLHV